jgi:hypothetical protein
VVNFLQLALFFISSTEPITIKFIDCSITLKKFSFNPGPIIETTVLYCTPSKNRVDEFRSLRSKLSGP